MATTEAWSVLPRTPGPCFEMPSEPMSLGLPMDVGGGLLKEQMSADVPLSILNRELTPATLGFTPLTRECTPLPLTRECTPLHSSFMGAMGADHSLELGAAMQRLSKSGKNPANLLGGLDFQAENSFSAVGGGAAGGGAAGGPGGAGAGASGALDLLSPRPNRWALSGDHRDMGPAFLFFGNPEGRRPLDEVSEELPSEAQGPQGTTVPGEVDSELLRGLEVQDITYNRLLSKEEPMATYLNTPESTPLHLGFLSGLAPNRIPLQVQEAEALKTVPEPPPPPGGLMCCDDSLPSAGSAGHPLLCARPCKYAGKPKGCKDGKLCTRCHMCQWRRVSEKQGASQQDPRILAGIAA